MKVVTVCGMGFGTSLMLLMSVKESGRKYGITVEGEATDLGSYKGKSCDLIVASSEIAKQIEADVPVLAVRHTFFSFDSHCIRNICKPLRTCRNIKFHDIWQKQ